ncbi:cytochrome P450 [Linderina pennispora]|uniref:Cytochrome P450 n=1 Tax=Linderina pennispora TaxID=61395 RepID=A0A1Y1WID3_9FUNG|nr:cytochrome P450 [Linderina pennispora]ORX73125.1 cytochrome P450 [Linderina pennispora]
MPDSIIAKHAIELAKELGISSTADAIIAAATCILLYFISTPIYHLFLSPLARVPGPRLNAISNIPLNRAVLAGNYHLYSRQMHEKYGPVVRLAPNKVSTSNTSDTRTILATHAFRKSQFYDQGKLILPSLFSTTDPETNKVRRRQLGNAFAMHTIRSMEDLVIQDGAWSLVKHWRALAESGGANNGWARANYYQGFHSIAIDVIGALGFGHSFGILQSGNAEIISWINDALKMSSIRSSYPITKHIPWMFKKYKRGEQQLISFVKSTVAERRKLIQETGKPPREDILQRFIEAVDPATGQKITEDELHTEIILLNNAGTDTTSHTLSWTLMYLLHYPDIHRRVCKDIRSAFPDHSAPIRYDEAKSLPYLTAVIYESLRMMPSVSGLLPRVVPSGGFELGGYHIPGKSEICLAFAACQRNSEMWDEPNRFKPERFLGPHADQRMREVMAFSSGVRVCIGRNLAWVELYTVLANILREFDMRVPEDSEYGPQRKNEIGEPAEIPGAAFITCGPRNPKVDCWIDIRRHSSAV